MYCVHRSTTAAVRLSNVLIKTRTISRRGIRTSNLGMTAVESLTPTVVSKLDEILPEVADFPARHIGPRKHDAKAMLAELGYKVRLFEGSEQ
jgi:hypothetical protein